MSQINVTYDIAELTGAVKLSIQTVGDDMPGAAFAIEVLPKSKDPKNVNYRFSHICNLSELVEFPDTEDPNMCYFRTDSIELILDTMSIALLVRDNILADITRLVKAYNQMNNAEVAGGTVTITG